MSNIKVVFVTGGTGNIGNAVVKELVEYQYSVKVLCRNADSAKQIEAMGATPVSGSLEQPLPWLDELYNCDAFIHTACTFDENMAAVDLALMEHIASQSKKRVNPLILLYTSGCWTYGSHVEVITESTAKNSVADFQWMLDSIDLLSEQKSIDLRVVSPANVVNYQEHFLPPILLWELERCGHPNLPRDENQTWSLVERANLAQLYRLVLEKGRRGEEYIGSAEHAAPLKKLLQQLSKEPLETDSMEQWKQIYGSWTEGYGLSQEFSSDKAIAELGWKPKMFIE